MRRFFVRLILLALVGSACEYDPSTLSNSAALTECAGVAATHGYGFDAAEDPAGGSSYTATEGNDVIVIANGPVTVDAGSGDDTICVNDVIATGAGELVTIIGGDGNDTVIGSTSTTESCDAETTSNCDDEPIDCSVGNWAPGIGINFYWSVLINSTEPHHLWINGVYEGSADGPFGGGLGTMYFTQPHTNTVPLTMNVATSIDGPQTTCGVVPGPIECSVGSTVSNGVTYWTLTADTTDDLWLHIGESSSIFGDGPIPGLGMIHFLAVADNTEPLDLCVKRTPAFGGGPLYFCGTVPPIEPI